MASLAEVAGQYGFLLFNANGIGNTRPALVLLVGSLDRRSGLHLLQGIEVSAWSSASCWLSSSSSAVYAIVAIIRLQWDTRTGPHVPTLSWFNPTTLSLTRSSTVSC